ncbi:MAG: DUF4418 family protein [Clostridia bacterium]|nr:DUF4418 family protein [Clostridia bacterium]
MKKTIIPALIVLILSLLAALGSQTFLGACVHEDGSFGACHWACRAILGEGGLLAVLSLLALALKRERAGLYLAMLPASVLGLLTPGTLIALCKMPTMRCRMLTQPAMLILFGAMLVAALVGWLLSRRGEK